MNTLVITEQGSRLTRHGGQLILFKQGEKILVKPLIQVSVIIVMGRVEISSSMLGFALRQGIIISYLTIDGRYKGHISSPYSKNIFIRINQFDKYRDPDFRLLVAKQIVTAKIHNYARLLQKRSPVTYQAIKKRLYTVRKSINAASGIETLRGLEGSFSALYFRNLPAMLIEDFGFKKRIKHPPPDPLNVLLSLAYTALFNNVYAFVESAGLDPYCGMFHEMGYGHPALVSDLMEEFRAPIADQHVINLVNKKRITPEHFFIQEKHLRLSKEGIALFFNEYRLLMENKFNYNNMQLNFLQIIEKQVQHFMRVLKGEDSKYAGYKFR